MFLLVRRNQLTLRGRHPLSRPIQDVLGAVLKTCPASSFSPLILGLVILRAVESGRRLLASAPRPDQLRLEGWRVPIEPGWTPARLVWTEQVLGVRRQTHAVGSVVGSWK